MQADSLMAVQAVANVSGFIHDILPGIGEQGALWLAKLVCGAPIVALIFANEWVGRQMSRLSPTLAGFLAPLWERFKWLANPLLGAIAGGVAGDSTLGMAAGVLWGIVKGGSKSMFKADLSAVTKAKAIVAILALGLWFGAVPTYAQEAAPLRPKPANILQQTTFGLGVGIERTLDTESPNIGFLDGQLGMSWNHLAPRVRLVRYFGAEAEQWKGEVAIRLIVW